MPGTDRPCTSTSPASGISSPTMCLMQTDLPVPEGPMIIETSPSGRPMFSPRNTVSAPEGLVGVDELDRVRAAAGVALVGVPAVLVITARGRRVGSAGVASG